MYNREISDDFCTRRTNWWCRPSQKAWEWSRPLSMSELISSKLPGMVAEEWNQKNPFLAIKVQVQSSSHVHHMLTLHSNYIRSTNVNYMLKNQHIVSHHIVKLIYTAYNMLTLVTCEGLVSWPWPWHDLLWSFRRATWFDRSTAFVATRRVLAVTGSGSANTSRPVAHCSIAMQL